MISFFQKKVYLVDYLHGLVDIHNHILPGIDDGAKTVDDSLELLNGFAEFGMTKFICTPHIMHNLYDNTPKTISKSFGLLSNALVEKGITKVQIEFAAEHMIDDNFEALLEKGDVLPIGKHHLLVEMSYLQPSFNFDIAVHKIAKKNYFPVLAHPERYMYFHSKYGKYQSMKANGIQFQLNLLSLTSDSYGSDVKKIADKLLNDGFFDFVGTDVHNMRQLGLLKEVKVSKKILTQLLPIIESTIQNFY